ncbi:uncharacterized protein MONOS_3814 [Monocercomonoides exilis]|uniref:uncharacterized protein n=1 Tax=Monocercomonoides exilis TaxID=2049356 RepID=UPI003559D22F|nr:hypothetical protein MONOS_3814 [Monocercomonoides exilis]
MSGVKFITFCFFDGNSATNGRGNDVFFSGNAITQSPFENCGSTTPTQRVWNNGTADNAVYNGWLPLIAQNKIVASNGTDVDACGRPQQTPCATIEYALNGFISLLKDASLTLLSSTFVPIQTLTFSAVDTKITGNGTDATTIASSGIPQPQNSHSHSSQSTSSLSSLSSLSTSSSPDPSATSALFQQTQGSLTVSALAVAHNSTNQITPILFHLSDNSPSLNLNTTTITGTTSSSSSITTPLFFLTAGSLALNHTAITQLSLNSQSIFHLTSLTNPLTLNSSNITHITSTATPASCVLSSATSPALSLSLANCTITNINSAPQNQQTATDGGCISFASSVPANSFSVSDTIFSTCSVSEDTSSGGRGGALMIEYKDDSEVSSTTFSVTNIVFSANKASVGRDMYFVCGSFVVSVKEPLFAFMTSITQKDNSVAGHDRTEAFGDWDVDLFIFFDGFFDDTIYVDGISGVERVYCGLEKAPCLNVNCGMERLKRTLNVKEEIILSAKSSLTGCVDVSNMCIKAKTETIVEIECQREVSGSEACVLKSSSPTEMEFIGIVVPSTFNRVITSVIESSTQNGELHMKNCEMSVNGGKQNTIGYFLIKSTGKMVELDSVTISDAKSTVSLFSISPLLGTVNDQEYKVKLLNCTTEGLEIDGGEEAAVFGGSVGVGMAMNGSKIEGAVSEKSKEGGALKIVLSEGGYVSIENSSFVGCVCEDASDGGKGGGIYLDCSLNEVGFQLTEISFSGCRATVGKNMFVKSGNLVNTVKIERFAFDCSGYSNDGNAFVGEDGIYGEMDLRVFLVSLKWTVVSVSKDGHDTLGCGSGEFPCYSIDHGLLHLTSKPVRLMFIVAKSMIEGEINLEELNLSSKSRETCEVEVKSEITSEKNSLISTTGTVSLLRVNFVFDANFISSHESLISPEGGILEIVNCSLTTKQLMEGINAEFANIPFHIIKMEKGELQLDGCTISNLILQESALYLSSQLPSVIYLLTICNSTIETFLININECGQLTIKDFNTENITVEGNGESLISCLAMKKTMQLANCTMDGVSSKATKGKLMKMEDCTDMKMDSCIFDGSSNERNEKNSNTEEEMCRWDGSVVDVEKSSVLMKDTTISNSPEGGITMSGGEMTVNDGRFENNNPSIEGYPSLRRNIICSDSGTLNVMSLKGGDGLKDSTSLWILNDGCGFEGIVSERDSSFFIPVLESVEAKEETDRMKLTFKGMLLVPCNLSFSVVKKKGDEKEIEHYDFDSNEFLSEREVEGSVAKDLIGGCGDEIEVSVHVLFGNAESPSSTNSFILKNASITQPKDDERIVEGGNKNDNGNVNMIEWSLFAFIGCVAVIIILLFVIVAVVVLLRRKLREAERKAEAADSEAKQIMEKIERRRENNGGSFEMSEMPSTLLEGMTSQIPLLIDNDEEDLPEPPPMTDGEPNENDHPDLESPVPFSEDDSVSGISQSHSFNVISAKKPFREKEKKNIKTLHSVIHSVQGNFTLGTRAMDVVDGKQVVKVVAELFEHLISVDDERVEMMARQLCPYSIFVEEGNNEIYLLTEELEDEKQKEEMKRWKAPEIGNEEEEEEEEGIEQAVVFTLGLILHEMTTGEVPLSECEAEEAQEMMRDGVRPLIEGIEGEEMVELIERMWADEPDGRPTLGEVIQSLTEMAENDAE